MSTVGPAAVVRLRAVLPDSVMLLDAPVVGSLAEADAGTLTLLVGGSPDAVTKARPLLLILGDAVHLGPTGAGAAGYAGLHRVAQPRPVSRPDARTAWYQRPGRHRPRAALHVGGRWRTPRAAIFGA